MENNILVSYGQALLSIHNLLKNVLALIVGLVLSENKQ